jgi:hypothetical protein
MKTLIASLVLILGLSAAAHGADKPCLTTDWVETHDPFTRMVTVKQMIASLDGKMTGEVRIYRDNSAVVSYYDPKGCMLFAVMMSRRDAEFRISRFGGQGI